VVPAAELTDEAVVAAVLDGELALFETLMRRYNRRLYRVARGIVRDPSEAEDVVQQAYLNAYAHLNQFAGRARFSTWLTRIAVHEASARLRRHGRLVQPLEGDEMDIADSPAPNPEQLAQASELRGMLEQAIDTLPPAYRAAFVLREVEQLNTAETAACLDTSEDAVKMRLHRAKGMLREELVRRVGREAPELWAFDGARCDRIVGAVMSRLRN
jgi:RNA polymerase sigma-70 factor, ECF subfamily